MWLGQGGEFRDDLLKQRDCAVEVAECGSGGAESIARFNEARFQSKCSCVRRNGFLCALRSFECKTEVEVRHSESGVESDRLAKGVDGAREVAAIAEAHANRVT